jgi:hypothetical protein
MHVPSRTRPRPRSLLLALAAVALLGVGVGVATASAASSIVGVWSFGGGQIAVKSAGTNTFVGIVVAETTFAECPHPVGQEIWTGMTEQADGSYWGLHQWYYEKTCGLNKSLGPTAWRVKEEPNGAKYLRVCFSKPGTTQPEIPATGPEAQVTYGCLSSALVAPLPTAGAAAFKAALQLSGSKQCLSGRLFKIHLAEPKYDPFKTIRVTLRGHRLATVRRGGYVVATVNLGGLPPGAFTVNVKATTVLGEHLSGSRTYHTCARRPKKHKPARLKATKTGKSH